MVGNLKGGFYSRKFSVGEGGGFYYRKFKGGGVWILWMEGMGRGQMGFQDKWLRYDEYVEKNRKLKGKAI